MARRFKRNLERAGAAAMGGPDYTALAAAGALLRGLDGGELMEAT
jgi:hypothetical protein